MNTRIEELAAQAYKEFADNCSYTNISPIFPELRNNFSKLIINELEEMLKLHGQHYDWIVPRFKQRLGENSERTN